MRILCVGNRYPPWSRGGYEISWAGAVRALRDAGHPTRVLTTLPDPTDQPEAGPPEPDVHRELSWYWREHQFPPIGLRACAALERANAAVFRRHVRDFEADVVMWWAMGGMSLSLLEQARRARLPALGVVGDDWIVYGPSVDGWMRRWRGWGRVGAVLGERLVGVPARLDLDRAAAWAFNSRYTRASAREAGWDLPDASIVHPGIDAQRFAWRRPGPWRWRLLYCGRVDPRKGIATAVEAMGRLPAEATLTIHGDGDAAHAAELASLAMRVRARDRVTFQRSEHAEVPAAYAAADAVLFPVTWREPWGLVPLEAMSIGRPVLASRAGGGPAEYLRDGDNCLQFDPGDAAGLAAAVQRLAASPDLVASMCGAGRQTAARFTDRAFHAELERQLEGVLAQQQR